MSGIKEQQGWLYTCTACNWKAMFLTKEQASWVKRYHEEAACPITGKDWPK